MYELMLQTINWDLDPGQKSSLDAQMFALPIQKYTKSTRYNHSEPWTTAALILHKVDSILVSKTSQHSEYGKNCYERVGAGNIMFVGGRIAYDSLQKQAAIDPDSRDQELIKTTDAYFEDLISYMETLDTQIVTLV